MYKLNFFVPAEGKEKIKEAHPYEEDF